MKKKKMKLYKITWTCGKFGESNVQASSKKGAMKLADAGKDEDFYELNDLGDWSILDVEEIKD